VIIIAQRWPDDQRIRWTSEKASWALGISLLDAGDAKTAVPLLERAYTSSRLAAAADLEDGVAQRRYRNFMLAYGQGLIGTHTPEGIRLIRRSQYLREQWWQRSPTDDGRQRDWIIATLALGDALVQAHSLTAACGAYRRAGARVEALRAERRLTALDAGRLTKAVQNGASKNCHVAEARARS
jgi:hypothetical protein